MIFSSVLFTFVFLPAVLLIYYGLGFLKLEYRNLILLIASLVFYAFGEPMAIWLMIGSICVNYFVGILISSQNNKLKKRIILIVDIIINISILFVFKYLCYTIGIVKKFIPLPFERPEIALPIGISFFTFQAMSYVIDVYREDVPAEKNILNVGLYISFFPQLVAGPIVRYNTVAEQIRKRFVNLEKFGYGAKRFMCGFCKKIIIANNVALIADYAFKCEDLYKIPISTAWIGSIAFSLQIFFDFSGYSDMAIGLGKMFGFDFSENFNYPYISKTITEFWRRWHISLSQWFRDYVYFPLGGSRVSVNRHIINLFIVWALTGLWHGANVTFVAWGLMYFVILVFEKYVLRPDEKKCYIRIVYQIITLFIVNAGWVLFNIESFSEATLYFKSMFGLFGNSLYNDQTIRLVREYGFFFVIGLVFSTPIIPTINSKFSNKPKCQMIIGVVEPILYVFVFLWAVSYLILGAHNPFIYFNF